VDIEAVIEVPKGSRNKYETDEESGLIWLDRMLFTATQFPADYGYIPGTLGEDGDPLDVIVLLEEPTFPGCHIRARVVGILHMTDEHGDDDKVVAVPRTDPRWADTLDVEDIPVHLRNEIAHFFEVYKELEPGKSVETWGWSDVETARAVIERAKAAAG
jgi:inorganic pyrophosphatase